MPRYAVCTQVSIEEEYEIDDTNKTTKQLKNELARKLAKNLDDAGIDNYVFASTQVQYEKLEDE